MSLKKLGVLDFGYRHDINPSSERVHSVIKEAVLLEKLGFSKIWYAEHFTDSLQYIWASPDMLIPIIAAHTESINVGIAGTCIKYNNPLKIAKDYHLLAETFGKRIDLGFSKGMQDGYYGSILNLTIKAIEPQNIREELQARIKLTIDLIASQHGILKPDVWNLVGSSSGYETSFSLGANCSRTLFHLRSNIQPDNFKQQQYVEGFYNKFGKTPKSNICVAGTIQKDSKLIEEIKQKHLHLIDTDTCFCGSPSEVSDLLHACAEKYQVEEIIFFEMSFREIDRKNSFKSLGKIISKLPPVIEAIAMEESF